MAAVVQVATGTVLNDVTCTATLTTPAVAGNLLVAVMTNNRSGSNAVIPSGFVEVGRQSTSSAANLTIARRVAVGGEAAVTYTAGASSRLLLSVFEVSGVDLDASLPIAPVFSTAPSGTTHTTGSISGGDVYIAALSTGTGATAGTTWRGWDNGFVDVVSHDCGAASNNVAQSCAYKNSTATDSTSQTWSGAATSVAALIKLKSSGGTTDPGPQPVLADKLRVGGLTPTALYVGATPVTEVYNGPTLVWP